jgi:hypothetical protein
MDSQLTQKLFQDRVDAGIQRRDRARIRKVFDQFKQSGSDLIPPAVLLPAMLELKSPSRTYEALTRILENLGLDGHTPLDFEQFERVANHPTKMEEHVRAIPLHKLLSDALPVQVPDEEADPIHFFSRLTEADIKSVAQGLVQGLERLLTQHVCHARQVLEAARRLAEPSVPSKFQVAPMSCGRIGDFHAGLSGRIGGSLHSQHALRGMAH